ncbi:MAG: alpha-ketoacid dehydrogenase subunit beta [Opitutales bacterium]|nr:alpha-ketoacid dehydrogenase subunit beta [Opitutales bacterium]NRA26874.1 alpha-ketoacid dehydrogenase subunit beta [Opitutales bacterium]
MRRVLYNKALNEALAEEMERDERVILMGEDIGLYGGVFKVTSGLWERFGGERVIDTPISETGFLGAALGAAMNGYRPVVEIMWIDFTLVAADQIINQIAKARYMSGGQVKVPLVIRTQMGGFRGNGAQHSQCLEALFAHIPGLKVVIPSTPSDAKRLLKASIRDDDPVLFIEHKMLYPMSGDISDEDDIEEIGKGKVVREGTDATIVSWSRCLHFALDAAEQLSREGKEVEVVDVRSLVPLDEPLIFESVRKTNRLVVAHEPHRRYGPGAELVAQIQEHCFDYLDAPIVRVGAWDCPIPYSRELEKQVLPGEESILQAVREVLDTRAQ